MHIFEYRTCLCVVLQVMFLQQRVGQMQARRVEQLCTSFTLYKAALSWAKLMSLLLPKLSDSSIFPPNQAADESSEEASFYEILPCCARFRCGELIAEGQWHHLVLVMSKGMLKNSMATLYLDGQLVNTVKVKVLDGVSHFTAWNKGSGLTVQYYIVWLCDVQMGAVDRH